MKTPTPIERVTVSIEPLVPLPKAAALCGVSATTMRRMVREKSIRAVIVGQKDFRIPAWAVLAFSKGEPCK